MTDSRFAARLFGEAPALDEEELLLEGLTETLRFARARCPRYHRYPDLRLARAEDFAALPILRRADLMGEAIRGVLPEGAAAEMCVASSATSTGRNLFVPRSEETQARVQRYGRRMYGPRDDAAPDGLTLRLVRNGRVIFPARGEKHVGLVFFQTEEAGEAHWSAWDHIVDLLFTAVPMGGRLFHFTRLHAIPPYGLYLLTRRLEKSGLSPADTHVKRLFVAGDHLGAATRRWLEERWGTTVVNTYSMSEMSGWADACGRVHGRYHFNHIVHAEVVSRGEERPVAPGEEGKLLLTGLYPFHHAMLLRYEVGDWVRWHGLVDCECGQSGATIDFLGRQGDLTEIEAGGETMVLPTVPVREALDEHACVPKVATAFYWEPAADRVTLHVECFSLAGPAWRDRIGASMAEGLRARIPALAAATDRGLRLEIALHAHGKLRDPASRIRAF